MVWVRIMKMKIYVGSKLYEGAYRILDENQGINEAMIRDYFKKAIISRKSAQEIRADLNSASLNVEFYNLFIEEGEVD